IAELQTVHLSNPDNGSSSGLLVVTFWFSLGTQHSPWFAIPFSGAENAAEGLITPTSHLQNGRRITRNNLRVVQICVDKGVLRRVKSCLWSLLTATTCCIAGTPQEQNLDLHRIAPTTCWGDSNFVPICNTGVLLRLKSTTFRGIKA